MGRATGRGWAAAAAIAGVLAAGGGAQGVHADFGQEVWRYFKPIEVPANVPPDSLVEVAPDPEVYLHAAPNLSDLRVVEAAAQVETPFKMTVERGDLRRSALAVAVQDLQTMPGEWTSFVVDVAREGVLHNEVEVLTKSQNFQRQVTVESSTDRVSWAQVQDKGQIFDLTIKEREFTTHDTRVQYPTSTARYLRVRIADDGEPALQVTGAAVYMVRSLAPQFTQTPLAVLGRSENAKERTSVLLLDTAHPGLPVDRVTIATAQENFYRRAMVEASPDRDHWSQPAPGEFFVFRTARFRGDRLTLTFPETTARYLRLTLFNEDDRPLPVDGLTALGVQRKVLFQPKPGATYRLYYGSGSARAPSYDLERVFPYLVTEDLPVAKLGAETPNPAFAEEVREVPFTERYPWLVPSGVGVASLLVGLFLASLLREVRKILPPPPDGG